MVTDGPVALPESRTVLVTEGVVAFENTVTFFERQPFFFFLLASLSFEDVGVPGFSKLANVPFPHDPDPPKKATVTVTGLRLHRTAMQRGVTVLWAVDPIHVHTIVNPSYTTFIAHRNPEVCPLGTMVLYFHWLHDLYELPKKMSIDWESNKSWQHIRLLFGADPVVPYNENSLYSLYCMAYKKSNFESNIKQHLPRHMLGYLQEKMGVDSSDTAKLGWSRGTYMDTYAPALPKNAILGTHGYKVHENYDPIWCHVRDPEPFLSRKCPNAESILKKIDAIYQVQPKSALFKLPALQNPDVRNWMSSVFPVDLKRLNDSEKEPLDLARIQNEALCLSLEEVRVQLVQHTQIFERMEQKFERRTAVFSPAKGYSNEAYARSAENSNAQTLSFLQSDDNPFVVRTHAQIPDPPPPSTIDAETRACEDTGLYEADDCSLRAFFCASPARKDAPRPRTQLDLVLPPLAAFHKPGAANLVWPPIFGQKYVAWPEIFPLIHDPQSLFGVWKPSKSLNEMTLTEVWKAWSVGEAAEGPIPGKKPPLRLVEHFKAKWRSTAKSRKFWECFREVPEWIETETSINSKSPEASISELEALRNHLAKRSAVGDEIILIPLGMNALAKHLTEQRKAAAAATVGTTGQVDGSDNLTSGNGDGAEATSSSTIPAKRKAPIASRAKSAKFPKSK
ncbi:hypothetical protein C8J57DRAFT_1227995 [Mycena rebaudengoi]|nr:hypothetical protein C8J57DRAFT_1227995 [Mycena rebaudengoi]